MALEDPFGNNRIEDVSWLCSLTESELDMLISLRKMVIQRAKVISHTDLANKIDLKMLRALGFILMEYCKVQMRDQGLAGSDAFLDKCNLLDTSLNGDVDIQDLLACVTIDLRKRKVERKEDLILVAVLNSADIRPKMMPVQNAESIDRRIAMELHKPIFVPWQ